MKFDSFDSTIKWSFLSPTPETLTNPNKRALWTTFQAKADNARFIQARTSIAL